MEKSHPYEPQKSPDCNHLKGQLENEMAVNNPTISPASSFLFFVRLFVCLQYAVASIQPHPTLQLWKVR